MARLTLPLLAVSLTVSGIGCSAHRKESSSGGANGSGGQLGRSGGSNGAGGNSPAGTGGATNGGGWATGGASSAGGSGARDNGTGGASGGGGGNGGVAGVVGFHWRTLPSLVKKRQNAMGVAVSDAMYVIGGFDQNGLLVEVERLSPTEAAWMTVAPLPNAQCCAAAAVLGGQIAVAGGYGPDGHTPTNALLLFDTTTEVWTSGPPMPTARANAMAAIWNGKLAVIGGGTQYGATQPTGVIEIYDPPSNAWTTSTLIVTPRAGGVAVADSDRIYVIGGAGQGSLYGDRTVEIVTSTGTMAGPPLVLARAQIAAGLLPSGIVIAGGWTPSLDTPTTEFLVAARTAWQPGPPMPTSRAGAAAAVINGRLIVAGGGQYRGTWTQQDVVEALEASPN